MRVIGQRRINETFMSAGAAAVALGLPLPSAASLLKRNGAQKQTLIVDGDKTAIYMLDDVNRVYRLRRGSPADRDKIRPDLADEFVGTSEAGEILGTPRTNAAVTLKGHGVLAQTVMVGAKPGSVYPRKEVQRIRQKIDGTPRRKNAAKAAAEA